MWRIRLTEQEVKSAPGSVEVKARLQRAATGPTGRLINVLWGFRNMTGRSFVSDLYQNQNIFY